MIAWMNFYPMVAGASLLSLQSGQGSKLAYAGLRNYEYLLKDPIFRQAMTNNFLFLSDSSAGHAGAGAGPGKPFERSQS